MSNDPLIIGNVRFDKSAVVSYEKRTVPAEYFGKDGKWTDAPVEKWFVTLKQGTQLIFPEQDTDYTIPSVDVEGNNITFAALERAKIIDTTKSENFNFQGCKSIKLKSNNGGGVDTVTSSDLFLMGGKPKPKGKCSGSFNAGDIVNGYICPSEIDVFF
jgi:hypothetical protein